ncbi:hypothetical protein CCR85_04760 [Rhodothalassium salexigens]|uniref:hypothetical protein n=1 Tax=Rhodothalassium salexigens TaxID=1086 RepID=UPI00191462C4|nr:hypothetical protein [Rhodothalassium salexigens]MBK5910803.1 hypothetical protein [Rhodothalassium salexigens]MBK5920549.1 hypothetical protein [Rhodothalassium salexigens]
MVAHNPPQGAPGTRPVIGVTVGTATYYSMHAPSGVAVALSRTYVSGMIAAAAGAQGADNYVIGGDFNCPPGDLYTQANPIPRGHLYDSGEGTCGVRNLDYFTANGSAANRTALTDVTRINLISDHIAVSAHY